MKVKTLLAASLLCCAAFGGDIEMYKDPNCGCCGLWAKNMQENGLKVNTQNVSDIVKVKNKLNVPEELSSCHTAKIDGYVIEGHVPADEIKALLEKKPNNVIGIAVPGMPLGSPGMEYNNMNDTYDVIAFYKDGSQKVWAKYKGSKKIQ